MGPEPPPYLLFESPSEYYATCERFFDNLADAVPEFYSDYNLVLFCHDILPHKSYESEDIRQSHPASPPSRDTEVLLYTASKLQLESYDWVTTGPILEKTAREIIKDFGLDPPAASTAQFLGRLSFVVPKVLVFPDAADVEPEDRAFYSYRRLCVHLAQQLLPLPLFSRKDGRVFAEQLQRLSEYQLHEGPPDLLPCIAPETEDDQDETVLPLEPEWFEHIEAAALELADEEDGEGFLRSAPQIIQQGIHALSQCVLAQPPFPDVEALLTEYCKENGGDPWRYALEIPTPRPLLWAKDLFAQVHRTHAPRIHVANTADASVVAAQAQQAAVKCFRVRRDLAWPEEKST
jgi:hypothetical protein